MKIELVSFRIKLSSRRRLSLMIDIINSSESDLIVFCGHSLSYNKDIIELKEKLENISSTILFEVRSVKENRFINESNCLFLIKDGCIHNLYTHQIFATREEIDNKESVAERLINELETRRRFSVGNKSCLVLQCGENGILRNIQKQGNMAVFRLHDRKDLEDRFNNILKQSDIVLNPLHTVWGNQDKMKHRRMFLSADSRYYFSVSQNDVRKRNGKYYEMSMDSKSLHYAFYDGKPFDFCDKIVEKDYHIKVYNI